MKMDEVMKINAEKGQFFFSEDTMNFFDSIVESEELINGEYFVTSEQFSYENVRMKRLYTVRKFDVETGGVDTVGEFQQFGSVEEAEDFIETL